MSRYAVLSIFLLACKSTPEVVPDDDAGTPMFYLGADLSYVNELEECGAVYLHSNGKPDDPYQIFAQAGANIIRYRLWHTPEWTSYSTLSDVKVSISRAKALGFQVLLDFHFSDDWADPNRQQIPAAWLYAIDDTPTLSQLLHDYTYETLTELASEGLLPDIVQVGNEINPMILQDGAPQWPIDWVRNSTLLNEAIRAVRLVAAEQEKEIGVMLHIAQPENAEWWLADATAAGVTDFDWIGLSYYARWSEYELDRLGTSLSGLITTYDKRLMIVETAYPFTLKQADAAPNILGEEALVEGYEATPKGQLDYLLALKQIVKTAGGEGVIYWEPAWVSTSCHTQWAQGSHWDNATLFDHTNRAHAGMHFFDGATH